MGAIVTYDATVAARTRCADKILAAPDLLAAYEAKGGLAEDLQAIRDAGQKAEILSQAQSAAQAAGGAATIGLLADFAALQREYKAVMAVVQAVHHDLEQAQAPAEVIEAVDRILVNEAEVAIRTVVDAEGKPVAGKGGKAKKKAVKRVSQEALRAEIARDARALVNLAPAHAALAKRKVDQARLDKLLAAAEALAGKLADRAATKGNQKASTTGLHDAVEAQKQSWGACYRILASLGREDPRVDALLAETARKRPDKKK